MSFDDLRFILIARGFASDGVHYFYCPSRDMKVFYSEERRDVTFQVKDKHSNQYRLIRALSNLTLENLALIIGEIYE